MRLLLAALAAVAVLAAVVGGGWWYLDTQLERPGTEAADPTEAASAYLDAWARDDLAEMESLVREPPDGFVDTHRQLRDGLEARELRTELREVSVDVDGRATARVGVAVDVPDLGPLRWETSLRLLRERGSWGVAWEPGALHPQWRPGLRFEVVREPTDRAEIVAADGTVLAGPGERITYGFDPGQVDDAEDLAEAFDDAVDGSGDTVRRLYGRGGLVDGWFYPVVSLPGDEARERSGPLRGEPGVLRRAASGRVLLADGFAQHVVGVVEEATAEQLEALGDGYEPGDEVGQTGLEAALETRLAAGERVAAVLRDGSSGPVRATLEERVRGPDGDGGRGAGPVVTTLDVTVQRAVENALLGVEQEVAVAVVDGANGAVRAAASRPLDGFDRATGGRYAPGDALQPLLLEAEAAADDDAVDAQTLSEVAARLGFDRDPQLPLDAATPTLPRPQDEVELRDALAGREPVQTTVVHTASLVAAGATGAWFAPHLLAEAGPAAPERLSAGVTDQLRQRYETELDRPEPATATSSGAAGAGAAWALALVDDLGVVVLVEGGGEDEAAGVLERFARELTALRDQPSDLDEQDLDAAVDGPDGEDDGSQEDAEDEPDAG